MVYKLPKLKHTTLRTYRNLLNKHILPYMGGMSLQEMTTNSIQHFFNESCVHGAVYRTANAHFAP